MTRMGSYCRAYYVRDLAAFDGWRPDTGQLRPAVADEEGREVVVPRTSLADDDVVYLQEDLTVTDGIFLNEHVLFADISPEWATFCTGVLGFAPGYDAEEDGEAEPAAGAQPEAAAA